MTVTTVSRGQVFSGTVTSGNVIVLSSGPTVGSTILSGGTETVGAVTVVEIAFDQALPMWIAPTHGCGHAELSNTGIKQVRHQN